MGNFQEGHPCAGKDCIECETCIFDRDLFADNITPNEREKQNVNSKNNMSESRLCNNCVNLCRNYDKCDIGCFDASCKVVTYEAFGEKRPRRIDFNLKPNQSIVSPSWCPLKGTTPPPGLPAPSQVTTRPRPQDTGPYSSYTDRREKMKGLRKHIDWDDIKEGGIYVIPKILSQARKIVKVITKTNMCCTCHEISEYTGNEYSYNCTLYPSDLDAVFITELRNF